MGRFVAHWLTVTLAVGVAAWILPGIQVTSVPALLIAGLVVGFVNAIVRPILVILTLPLTVITLGLFYLVVNGLSLALAAWLTPGFSIASFGWAVLGAFLVGLVSWFVSSFARVENRAV